MPHDSTPIDETDAAAAAGSPPDEPALPPADGVDLERLAALDDRLGGHGNAIGAARTPTTDDDPPAGLEAILLLRQVAAEDQGREAIAEAAIPRRIDRFTIVREVGCGGFARVYEAFDTRLLRRVALKVARPVALVSPGTRRRFIREAELAARLDHPHVVTIHEAGQADGAVYIAEEFCTGGSLAEWLERHPGPLPPRMAARVVAALADAVAHSHGFCILHRDIKPGNVLLVPAADGPLPADSPDLPGAPRLWHVKLGDFGLGKLLAGRGAPDPGSDLTRADARIGTPAWMAPEQADARIAPVGPATDIHALGLLLDRLLTGRCQFAGADDSDTLHRVLHTEPIPPDRVVPGVPRDLAAVTLTCLARRPRDRYPTVADLGTDLTRFLDGRPTVVRPVSPVERALRIAGRHPALVAACTLAVCASTVAAGALALQANQRRMLVSRAAEIRSHQAAATLRRGFESWRTGDVAGAWTQLDACRALDADLAGSLAGDWLRARLHGEEAILLRSGASSAAPPASTESPPPGPDLHTVAVTPHADGGATIATGGADGILRLMSVDATGQPTARARLVPLHDDINDVAFSPDGQRVATVGQDGRVVITSVAEDTPRHEWQCDGGALFGVAWSPDGRTVACGGSTRDIHLLAADGPPTPLRVVRPFEGLEPRLADDTEVEAIVFLGDDRLAAACGNRAVIFDLAGNHVVHDLQGHVATIGHLAVSADRRRLLTAGSDRQPRVWDVASGTLDATLPLHPSWVAGCCFRADATGVVTSCRDGIVRLHSLESAGSAVPMIGHVGRVWDVAMLPGGGILSAGSDGTLRRWSAHHLPELAGVRTRAFGGSPVSDAVPLVTSGARGDILLARQGADPVVRLDTAGGETIIMDQGQVHRLVVNERRQRFVMVGLQFEIGVAALDGSDVDNVLSPWSAGNGIAWSGAAGLLVGGLDGTLLLVGGGADRPDPVDQVATAISALDVTFTGQARAVVVAGKEVRIHELSATGRPRRGSGRTLLELSAATGRVDVVAWAPDGMSFVIGTNVGAVDRYDAATGLSLGSFARHAHGIRSLQWSPEGRILVSADSDCVRFSDVPTTSVFDEFRPGWSIESARLGIPPSGPPVLVVAGNATTASPDPTPGRITVATFDDHSSITPVADGL